MAKRKSSEAVRARLIEQVQALAAQGVAVVHEPGLLDGGYVRGFSGSLGVLQDVVNQFPNAVPFRTYWNRITYGQHFRMPVAYRGFGVEKDGVWRDTGDWELAIDLLQLKSSEALEEALVQALEAQSTGETESKGGVVIGDYVPYQESLVWDFNGAFWKDMSAFMAAQGRDYRDSIQGSPDANADFVRDNAMRFLGQLQALEPGGNLDVAYVEIGVASVDYVTTFIDALAEFAEEAQFDLAGAQYVMADMSALALKAARDTLGDRRKGITLTYLHMNVEDPLEALRAYAGRILRVHVTNVLDNLPNDKLAQMDGRHFLIQTRLYLPAGGAEALSEAYGLDAAQLTADLEALPETGADAFLDGYRARFQALPGGAEAFYRFWQDLYGNPGDHKSGLKLEERYLEIPDLSAFEFLNRERFPEMAIDPKAILGEVLAEYPHNVWMHLSNRAVEGGLKLMSLLHTGGALEVVDIIVQKISDYHRVPRRRSRTGKWLYRMGFKGPAKFDGSAVDWFNGRLFEAAVHQVFPDSGVRYANLADYGKSQMTLMEVVREESG